MKHTQKPPRWLAVLACVAAITACGGGGGGGSAGGSTSTVAASAPPPPPDSRNGDYAMYAADAREYTLSLDFNTKTYRVTGNGQDLSGTIRESATSGEFELDPASTAPAAANAPRFTWFSDTVVGAFKLPAGTVPFIAARSFVTTLAEATGTYTYLTTDQDSAASPNNSIFSGEVLAAGTLRTCNDSSIFTIASCPTASVVTSSLSVSGTQFTANTGTGTFPFRIARVAGERVFLRASPSVGTLRRLWIGLPQATFSDAAFTGANTNGQGTSTAFAAAAYTASWNDGSATASRSGSVTLLGGTSPAGLARIDAGADGFFFAMHNTTLLVQVAGRNSAPWPGYMEIGKK